MNEKVKNEIYFTRKTIAFLEDEELFYTAKKKFKRARTARADLRRETVRLERLLNAELRNLSKDDVGFNGARNGCGNCADFDGGACRLLAESENGARPYDICSLWKPYGPE
jgi:hypothetical protein